MVLDVFYQKLQQLGAVLCQFKELLGYRISNLRLKNLERVDYSAYGILNFMSSLGKSDALQLLKVLLLL